MKAENGDLVSGGAGRGAFTRAAFMSRTWDGRLFPSYLYRYEHFMDALEKMATVGVDGSLFYFGHGQKVQSSRRDRRELQTTSFGEVFDELGPTEVSKNSLVYGLVNIAAFLAQAMADSIIHDACDELNTTPLPMDDADGWGLDDGNDHYRFPISNACGQGGRNYEDEICTLSDEKYDCVMQMNTDELRDMEARGVSKGRWGGAPGPFYCGPKETFRNTGEFCMLRHCLCHEHA